MFEAVSALADKSIGSLRGKSVPKIVARVLAVLLLVLLLDSKLHVLSSIANKNDIAVLSGLLDLENQGILDSKYLRDEYVELVESYHRQRHSRVSAIVSGVARPSSPQERLFKFASAALLPALLGVAYTVTAKTPLVTTRLGGLALLVVVAVLLGTVAMFIPTLGSPWVNYIGVPVLQLVLLVASVASSSRKRQPSMTKGTEPTP